MAKRFTDTQKWKRPWFRSLNLHAKLMWQYLCDECDHAGIFIADFELVSFQLGFKVDEGKLRDWLGDKIVKIAEDKYFIPSFFEFQYGTSDAGFRAKQGALRELAKYGLLEESGNSLKDLSKSYLSLIEAQGIGNGYGNGNSEKGCGEKPIAAEDLEDAYEHYPRKKGKSAGMRIARREIRTAQDLAALKASIAAYKKNCRDEKKEAQYILHFSTFMSEWRDWLDPSAGKAESFAAQTQSLDDLDLDNPGGAA